MTETFYHVTVLSNFARGFDKYSGVYSKARIPESTYPDRFFLLRRNEIGIGVEKVTRLLQKLGKVGNQLIALETRADAGTLEPNLRNGLGQFVRADHISLTRVHGISRNDGTDYDLNPLAIEDVMADSLRLSKDNFVAYAEIRPRAVSFLPVALSCQAKCPFCFSKASVSSEQAAAKPDWGRIDAWLARAKSASAERAVITGGGEPTLLPDTALQQLIAACASRFDKVVLITNGHAFTTLKTDPATKLQALHEAGLSVLAISRHHHDGGRSRQLMNLETPVERLIEAWRSSRLLWPQLRLRLICVLQNGGVENDEALADYVSWAAGLGVEEICFKELYVSTSVESVYYDRAANDWSHGHQVPLSLVTHFAERKGFEVESRLPWGAPVFRGHWQGRPLRIAAYTEPSLFWERTQGIARSWNVMADGRCYVSLEDRGSQIRLEEEQ